MHDAGLILIPIVGGAFAAATSLLLVLWLAGRMRGASLASITPDQLSDPRTFRFRNGYLVDHSDNVGFLLPDPVDRMTAWSDLARGLDDLLPGAKSAFRALGLDGTPFRLDGALGSDRIVALGRRDAGDLCLTVVASQAGQATVRIDADSLDAITSERDALIRADETSPALSWTLDAKRDIVWCNAAYRGLIERCMGPDAARGWPLRVLFPDGDGARVGRSRRKCIDDLGEEHWFDVTLTGPDANGHLQGHALSLDGVIKAETALRTFIQTLTKSFAVLPTGLAIFDRSGHLTLFNPALMDLTGLDGTLLSRRPHITDVFDQLRDSQKIPEPRDYKAWLQTLTDAPGDRAQPPHIETWTQPGRGSLRMTARPQDDGAITLLLEDVSVDISTERRARQNHDMFADVLGHVDTAVIAFDAKGQRTVATDLAQAMWFHDGQGIPLPKTLRSCLTLWASMTRPTPLWGEIRDLVQGPLDARASWDENLVLSDGTAMWIRVLPQPDGGLALALRSDRDIVPVAPVLADPPAMTA